MAATGAVTTATITAEGVLLAVSAIANIFLGVPYLRSFVIRVRLKRQSRGKQINIYPSSRISPLCTQDVALLRKLVPYYMADFFQRPLQPNKRLIYSKKYMEH